MEDLGQRIVQLLKEKAPLSLSQKVDELEAYIKQENYRLAYGVLYEIRWKSSWVPVNEYIWMMDRFVRYYDCF